FFLCPILLQILIVAAIPTPTQILSTLLQNDHVKGASVQLVPSIYNLQTIVTYGNNNNTGTLTSLVRYLTNQSATVDLISTDTILTYIQSQYRQTETIFIHKYQIAQGLYNNVTTTSLTFDAFYSTVNYHTAAVSLGVSMTQLYQFYSNSQSKQIITTNQPIITTNSASTSKAADVLLKLFCFDTIPLSLFGFLTTIVAMIFTSLLISIVIKERMNHSKQLQLMCKLPKFIYWFSNVMFDFILCLIICSILTIIIKIAASSTDPLAEVVAFGSMPQTLLFFLVLLLYSCASFPYIYVWSFYIN
ncbi:unnamed protein product, partial [Didymodactylos carnosus]